MATKELSNGLHYFAAVHRGTEYVLRRHGEGWGVSTRRIGYGGRFHMGGFKFFATLAAVASGCKAFGDDAALVSMVYGLAAEQVAA